VSAWIGISSVEGFGERKREVRKEKKKEIERHRKDDRSFLLSPRRRRRRRRHQKKKRSHLSPRRHACLCNRLLPSPRGYRIAIRAAEFGKGGKKEKSKREEERSLLQPAIGQENVDDEIFFAQSLRSSSDPRARAPPRGSLFRCSCYTRAYLTSKRSLRGWPWRMNRWGGRGGTETNAGLMGKKKKAQKKKKKSSGSKKCLRERRRRGTSTSTSLDLFRVSFSLSSLSSFFLLPFWNAAREERNPPLSLSLFLFQIQKKCS